MDGIPQKIETNFPQKVFIDVDIIKKSPEKFTVSSICFAISLIENLFLLKVNKKIINECSIDLTLLKNKIFKIEELLNWLSLSKDFALLNLMDYIIDLNNICKNNYESNSIIYSLLLNCSTLKNNFGEKCLFSSSILLNLYSSFLNQNTISKKNTLDRTKLIKSYTRRNKNNDFFDNYILKTERLLGKELNQNLNNNKKELICILNKYNEFLSKFAKKINLINNKDNLRMIDEDELFTSLQILPFIQNNIFLNIINRYGYLSIS